MASQVGFMVADHPDSTDISVHNFTSGIQIHSCLMVATLPRSTGIISLHPIYYKYFYCLSEFQIHYFFNFSLF
jgi:hypothetical protein